MTGIVPVPTTRVGDYFVRQRLIEQIQSDQLDLFRLQYQVSTGQRIQLPSEDPAASLRAIGLQRLLDRKGQIRTNVTASTSYLSTTDNMLADVSQQLSDLRGEVLGAVSTVTSEADRQATIKTLNGVLQDLINIGNYQSQGRYLFAGSQSQVQPYEYDGAFTKYNGNEANLHSYVDLQRLFETNIAGTDVFGGISAAVQGSVDLNPQLTRQTRLSSLNAGAGIGRNAAVSVSVESGGLTSTSVVDLAGATTIGDVARLIEAHPPGDAEITVDVTGIGLVIRTDTGTIRVDEVAQGRTAHELGIYVGPSGAASDEIVGSDLDPVVSKTTRLADLLGTKAQGRLESAGANNDILLTAARNGTSLNGVTVRFAAGGIAGSETATYDDLTKTLTVQVQAGFSTANQVAAAISDEGTFAAQADYRDAALLSQAGSNPVDAADFGVVTSGGSGEVLDTDSGLVLTNGGDPLALDVSAAVTVEDLLNLINDAGLGLLAEINQQFNGINVRSRLSGADLSIGEHGGTTATQLGIRTCTEATRLADFNRGIGVPTSVTAEDMIIVARNGTEMVIDLSDARTVQDVIDTINSHPENNVDGTAVLARLATTGNGIELVDTSADPVGNLTVRAAEGSQAVYDLGFVPDGRIEASVAADEHGDSILTSEDHHPCSTPLQGSVDLEPQLTSATLVSSLNGGTGIGENPEILVEYDIGGAITGMVLGLAGLTTIGAVAQFIEATAPPAANLTVEVTGTGLVVRSGAGTVRFGEVGEGQTAHALGIYADAGQATIVGSDVDPAVTNGTQLSDLLGTKAQGRVTSAGANNDILITAAQNGELFNGVTVRFVGGGTAGSETADYDADTNTLTVQVEAGVSTANQVAAAIVAEGTFTAQADYRDASLPGLAGTGPVNAGDFADVTSGGSGEVLDTQSGLMITSGGLPVPLDISGAVTVGDLVDLISGAGLGLSAEINDLRNGINVSSLLGDVSLSIGENGGTTATQLGIRTYTAATELADFNDGAGVVTSVPDDDLVIVARSGTELAIDLSGASTVQDVIDAINNHPGNNVNGTAVLARLATTGNGIELVDASADPIGDLVVRAAEGSQAAHCLGFVPEDQTEVSSHTTDGGGNYLLTSDDCHTLEVDSVFNTLIRLRTALENNDVLEISRSLDRLDTDMERVLYARADIGARLQSLDVMQMRLEDENVELQKALTSDLDVDLVEVISNLTARQYAMEASLRSAASLLQLTLLNYI